MAAVPSPADLTRLNRSAAYAARYVAKNIVAAGLADKCEIQFGIRYWELNLYLYWLKPLVQAKLMRTRLLNWFAKLLFEPHWHYQRA